MDRVKLLEVGRRDGKLFETGTSGEIWNVVETN